MPDEKSPVYQTLKDFYDKPFGVAMTNRDVLNSKYAKFQNLMKFHSYSILDDSYYIHIKVPSESSPGKTYDVVIQFIPPSDAISRERRLDNYVIQFFSNSPGFIYKYAVVYKVKGYMIDALQEKMDKEYADKLPTQTNADMKLEVDKSIYFAVKFLMEHNMSYMSKIGIMPFGKRPFEEFVKGVIPNKDMLNTSMNDVKDRAIEEGKVDKDKIRKSVSKKLRKASPPGFGHRPKISRTNTTVKNEDGSYYHSTVKSGIKSIKPKGKITAKRSTTKR